MDMKKVLGPGLGLESLLTFLVTDKQSVINISNKWIQMLVAVKLQTSALLLRAEVDVNTMPPVLQQSPDIPDTDVCLWLAVMRRVGRLGRYLDALASLCHCRKWHDCFPDGPGPLAAVWLRLSVQTGSVPCATTVHCHVDPLDAATAATHCIPAHRHLAVIDVDHCTVERATDRRLDWELLDRHHLRTHTELSLIHI